MDNFINYNTISVYTGLDVWVLLYLDVFINCKVIGIDYVCCLYISVATFCLETIY